MTRVASIARLKVTLDDVGPKVLRRLEVPFDLRLIFYKSVLKIRDERFVG